LIGSEAKPSFRLVTFSFAPHDVESNYLSLDFMQLLFSDNITSKFYPTIAVRWFRAFSSFGFTRVKPPRVTVTHFFSHFPPQPLEEYNKVYLQFARWTYSLASQGVKCMSPFYFD
jgi:hypothetical protein